MGNTSIKLREAFETYKANERWLEELGTGDIVMVDGNAIASSYLVISKNPLAGDSRTILEAAVDFKMPVEFQLGLHMSQRTAGQEFTIEAVADPNSLPPFVDVAISSMSQATTTLTVNTATPHNLVPGMRFGIRDATDSRFNYPALVVASTPTPTQFTATAGPNGTIPSLTAGPITSGFVFARQAMSRAADGVSMILENATATNASYYVRSESGDVLPSGTVLGNHSTTIGSTASVQAINAVATYAFQPTNEFRLCMLPDYVQAYDVGVDSVSNLNHRFKRTQVVPSMGKNYKLRFEAWNPPSLTRPVAQLVSATKAGSTTATIVTATPHGLTTGDQIVIYGIRDQTNFANLTTPTAVASVVNATTFTIAFGASATATSYGGYVSRVNGGVAQPGAIAQVAASITIANGVLTMVGNTTWAGFQIGDYLQLVGIRDNTTGATLNVDGAYRVRDVATTNLVLEPIGDTSIPLTLGSTNCGGGVIKRTDMRISFVRVLEFIRERVEGRPHPISDLSQAVSVTVQNSPVLNAGANAVGDVGVQYRANATGAASATHVVAAGSTNATVIKASPGRLLGLQMANPSAGWRYVKFHNQTTTPTAGTGVVRTFGIPPGGVCSFNFEGGIAFGTGIAMTIVTGIADADTAAVTANDVVGEVIWA